MATYLIMGSFTDQGIKNVKETIARGERFKEIAQECNVKILELMWIMGHYDIVSIAEADDDKDICVLLLRAGSRGFVKTHSFRAFTKDEMATVVERM